MSCAYSLTPYYNAPLRADSYYAFKHQTLRRRPNLVGLFAYPFLVLGTFRGRLGVDPTHALSFLLCGFVVRDWMALLRPNLIVLLPLAPLLAVDSRISIECSAH